MFSSQCMSVFSRNANEVAGVQVHVFRHHWCTVCVWQGATCCDWWLHYVFVLSRLKQLITKHLKWAETLTRCEEEWQSHFSYRPFWAFYFWNKPLSRFSRDEIAGVFELQWSAMNSLRRCISLMRWWNLLPSHRGLLNLKTGLIWFRSQQLSLEKFCEIN